MSNGSNPEWTLLCGQQVQLWKDGSLIRTGYVEDVTSTDDALWLRSDGVDGRALYERAYGYVVTPISAVSCPS